MEGIDLGRSFGNWILSDPESARAALDRLPDGQARQDAVQQSILKLFSNGSVGAAMEIVASYPEEVDDRLFENSISALAGSDPIQALSKIHLIKDPYLRTSTQAGILGIWMSENPAAAKQWLGSNELPDGVRKSLEKSGYRDLPEAGAKED